MAGKSSRTAKKRSTGTRRTLFSRLIWVIWAMVTGGSAAGWFVPDMPIVGPVVQRLIGRQDPRQAAPAPTDAAWRDKLTTLKDRVLDGQPATGELAAARLNQTPAASPPVQTSSGQAAPGQASPVQKSPDTIFVASYNIQVFGISKLSKPWVVDVLARVVRQFDVVAIQEVRSKEDRILPEFVAAINADGSRYDFIIGPRLGRSVSTEQYAFVYDTTRIEVDRSCIGSMPDPDDLLHREPFVARFRTRTQNPATAFSFWLVDIHTDPDEVKEEVDVLADVFQVMRTARPDEDDVILLGDLNASDRQFGRLGQIPGIAWAVSGTTTNTRGSKMYDNLLFDRTATAEYTGRWGVINLQSACGLTMDQALEVSDHLPVWAEFRSSEVASPNNTARLPLGRRQ